MGQFVTQLRRIAPLVLIMAVIAGITAAGQAAPLQATAPRRLRRKSGATSSPSWTPCRPFTPDNAGLARRVARVKEQLAALTTEQLAAVTPALSGPEFSAVVGGSRWPRRAWHSGAGAAAFG